MSRGQASSQTGLPQTTADALRLLGDSNMPERALSFGTVRNGAMVGKFDAVWAQVTLSASFAGGPLDVPHNLGRIPTLVMLCQQDGSGTCSVRHLNKDTWSASNVRVDVYGLSGSLSNLALTFLIGG